MAATEIDEAFASHDDDVRTLDQYYVPTRYPSGLDEETPPARSYDARCLRSAHSILETVKPRFAS